MRRYPVVEQKINLELPTFKIYDIVLLGEGEDYKAYLINDTFIFRFPKRKSVQAGLKKEIVALPLIRKWLQVQIPQFDYISPTLAFVGYQKIIGEELISSSFYQFPENSKSGIIKSVALFLTSLHSIDLCEIFDAHLETIDFKQVYHDDFEAIRKHVHPSLSVFLQEKIDIAFNSYLNNLNNFDYKPSLLHNDLSGNHILINVNDKQVEGIIDFGDMAIGDPDYDLTLLFAEFGENFINKLLQFYNRPNSSTLIEKLKFFNLANVLLRIQRLIIAKDEHEIKDEMIILQNWILKYYMY